MEVHNRSKRFAEAQQRLRDSSRIIRRLLNALPLDGREYEQALPSNYAEILKEIGRGLFNAAEELLGIEPSGQPLDFYFWPGYTCMLDGLHRGKRITIRDPIDCGIGFTRARSGEAPTAYTLNDASRWFDLLLNPSSCGSDPLRPGGTHNWFNRGGPALKLRGEGQESLESLIVACARGSNWQEGGEPGGAAISRGCLTIELDETEPRSWGDVVASRLNNPYSVTAPDGLVWPAAIDPQHDAPSMVAPNTTPAECRQALYSLWLMACFVPDWQSKYNRDALDAINAIRALAPVRATNAEIELLPDSVNDRSVHQLPESHYYRTWTTIHLDPAPFSGNRSVAASEREDTSTTLSAPATVGDELGTAMFLSNSLSLGIDFISLVRPWIQLQYLSLRYVERSREIDALSSRRALEMLAHSASNKIDVIAREIERVREGAEPSDLLMAQLWALRAEARLFQGKTHNHKVKVFALSEPDPIGRYVVYAWELAHARAARNREVSGFAESLYQQVEEAGGIIPFLRIVNSDDSRFLDNTSVVQLNDPIHSQLVRSESFGMMFVRCLYPAIYHWMRQSAHMGRLVGAPTIQSTLKNESVLWVEVQSPGDPWERLGGGRVSTKDSNDASEIQRYAQHFVDEFAEAQVYRDTLSGEWRAAFGIPLKLGDTHAATEC